MSFLDELKDTAKSLGGTIIAPAGLVWDVASAPFDSNDDSLGSLLGDAGKRVSQFLDPITNTGTFTGYVPGHVFQGAGWVMDNGINRPISTAFTVASHGTAQGEGLDQWLGFKGMFDGDAWAKAWDISDSTNAGEAFTTAILTGSDVDPLKYDNAFDEVTAARHPSLAPKIALGANIVGSWYLDPLVLAGKASSLYRANVTNHLLNPAERANAYSLIESEVNSGLRAKTGALGREGAATRTDRYLDWINGTNAAGERTNKLGRPLEAPEILYGTPQLRKYAAEPQVIAGLLADAGRIGDKTLARDAQRRILSIAAGDVSQIGRLRTEVSGSAAIADQLTNMVKQGSVDLKLLGVNPAIQHQPVFIQHLESQIKNLDSEGAVTRFMDDWAARQEQLLGTQGTMKALPGVTNQGRRAVLRQNDMGLSRELPKVADRLDEWAARGAQRALQDGTSSIFQRGVHSLPFLAVKGANALMRPTTTLPVRFGDALRQVHFTGVAHIHDWGGSVDQLESMMRMSNVSDFDRMKMLSSAYIAKTEPEKMRLIDQVEELSLNSLAKSFGAQTGDHIDGSYIKALMQQHAERRGAQLAQIRGRTYASTEMTDAMMAQRGRGMAQAESDAALMDNPKAFNAPQLSRRNWRVDQINDDGTLLSLPVLDTQLGNTVPLLDMGIARKVLERDQSHLSRLSRAWANDAKELDRLSRLKGAGAQGLDKTIAARQASMDWLADAGSKAMRMWKFSVLFRLGYPLRILADDYMRMVTQVSAVTLAGRNIGEAARNLRFNQFDRRAAASNAMRELKTRRTEILDELEGDRMVSHADKSADMRRIQNSIRGHQRALTKLEERLTAADSKHSLGLEAEDRAALREAIKVKNDLITEKQGAANYYAEELGDYGPADLKRQLEQIESNILDGQKALRPEKRHIGMSDVEAQGEVFPGAFAGQSGMVAREATRSQATFDAQMRGTEDRMFSAMASGSHRTIASNEAGHLDAWSSALNFQFRNSEAAMHFVKGGDVDGFVHWLRQPEQANLRRRVPHFAHDPEDWAQRIQAVVHDYIPSEELRAAVEKGTVTPRQLSKMFQDPATRPAVHGRIAADQFGTSHAALGFGKMLNRLFKHLSETPTDHLSRHPYFNTMYRQHVDELAAVRKATVSAEGRKFVQQDIDDIARAARKNAMHDLKRTLFDISAHSHAAHLMRFISPFFAAHQEVLNRWWRIVGDNPAVIRRFQQAFDLPRGLGLVVDENGDPVPMGAPISKNHRLLIQLPAALGGPNTDPKKGLVTQAKWQISENSFNLVLANGLTNPGAGPLVTVPVDALAKKYADQPDVARLAHIFNPYPPSSPMDDALPAAWKRAMSVSYAASQGQDIPGLSKIPGFNAVAGAAHMLDITGVGVREYNDRFSQNVQDSVTDFIIANGREPNRDESDKIMADAGHQTGVDVFLRLVNNAGSAFPANPNSKYAAVQMGWYKIQTQARTEGRDYEWMVQQFKDKWGAAYMPLIYSAAQNPAGLDPTAASIAAIKRYKGVLERVDPTLSRAVIGMYGDQLAQDPTMGAYSPEARNFLRTTPMAPGSGDTYYAYDDPKQAMIDQEAARGWRKYSELTGSLTAMAQQMGLTSYRDSDKLMALKRAAVAKLGQENYAWSDEYNIHDEGQYERLVEDMRTVVKSPALSRDPERTDIQVLSNYVKLHDLFSAIWEQRKLNGLGGPDSQDGLQVKNAYTQLVMQLVESNTYFEENMFNGLVERDPWLMEAA